jgi:hypothetical protein
LLIADFFPDGASRANLKSAIKNLKLPRDAKARSERRMPRPLDYQKKRLFLRQIFWSNASALNTLLT